jgi:poly-gamma-glutamate capsule biosynthesis protein CapA/YwtB (metallophosphatase superfamily)
MGLEYVHVPSAAQVKLANMCLAAGAHIVQYHHSHCLSGSLSDGRGIVIFGTGNYVFPNITRFSVATSRHTALWRARYSKETDSIIVLGVAPAVIHSTGMPCIVAGEDAEAERERIQQYGRRMRTSLGRHLSRLHDMLHPGFLLLTFSNYAAMLQRHGPVFVWRSIVAGLKAHFAS